MATEWSSVIAAICNAAKQCRSCGGIVTFVSGTEMIAQLKLLELQDPEQARLIIIEHREEIRNFCDAIDPVLVEHGGSFRDIQVHVLETRGGQILITYLIIDTRDAMGANALNSMTEALAPELERWTGGRINLRILSNLADRRLARFRGVWKLEDIGGKQVCDDILSAFWFAEGDLYRAATHNKGIMNGIAAIVLATGNDTRALEVCNQEKRVFSETVCLQRFLRISNN
jgi:hydroxymethylglutaryl-CoA reductase